MSDVELTPVRDAHKFDEQALEQYLQTHVEGFQGPMEIKQFEGGQSNPTFQLITASQRYVLRKQPPGELLPSAHQVDREYRVMDGLWNTEVPVPKMFCLCEDASVIGTKFYVMEMVEGRLFTETRLPDVSNEDRRAIYLDLARVMAKLHSVDPATVGLETFGRPGNYYERQIGRWSKQYLASQTDELPAMNKLMEWLPNNIPDDDANSIVHGDFRLDNMVLHADKPEVLAVLDWELSTLGHPLGDFTYHLMQWFMPSDGASTQTLEGADFDALNIPDAAEYTRLYCDATGRDGIENMDFYIAYNMFRLAGILQGIVGRVRDGTASNAHAAAMADRVKPLSDMGWEYALKAGAV